MRLPLSAYYSIQPGPQAVGMSSVIAVYEKDGSPAAGVTVSLDGAEIGLKRPALRRVLSVCASAPWSRSSFRKT